MNVYVIAGSTHGIGYALARRLLEEGMTVFGCAGSKDDSRGSEMQKKYHGYHHFIADVSDEEKVREFFSLIESEGHRVKLVIDCAGTGFAPRISSELCASEAMRVLSVNTLGCAYILKYSQKVMTSDAAFLVCGSVASDMPGTGADAVYGASKAALRPLLMSASLEEGNAGRAFVYLKLGYIETRMTACDDKKEWLRKTPYGQAGSPEETAELILGRTYKPGYSEHEIIGGGYDEHEHIKPGKKFSRSAGVLIALTSLPNKYGCGSLGSESLSLIDELYASGFTHVLLLPLNQTGFMNSPYSALSSMSGSINLISPEMLYADALLSKQEHTALLNFSEHADYESCCINRPVMIMQAYRRFKERGVKSEHERFILFCEKNKYWLDDYAVFMSAKYKWGRVQWQKWPDESLRAHDYDSVSRYMHDNQEDIALWKFSQFIFYDQFAAFRNYANYNGIKIICDIPFYVCADSSDVWAHRELFNVDPETGNIIESGGIPNRDGSITDWGVPTFKWDVHKDDGFKWWRMRIRFFSEISDGIRLDHSLGMLKYYAIPSDGGTPAWKDGPDVPDGEFSRMTANEASRNSADVIAEDLGKIPPGLRERIDELGFCGTRIMQYAFSNHYYAHSNHVPSALKENIMILTGTHDNMPLREFLREKDDSELSYMMYMLNVYERKNFHWAMIQAAYNSPARYCTIPVQDILELGNESCLVNRQCIGRSWLWRMKDFRKLHGLSKRLRAMAVLSGRLESTEQESSEALEYLLGEE